MITEVIKTMKARKKDSQDKLKSLQNNNTYRLCTIFGKLESEQRVPVNWIRVCEMILIISKLQSVRIRLDWLFQNGRILSGGCKVEYFLSNIDLILLYAKDIRIQFQIQIICDDL